MRGALALIDHSGHGFGNPTIGCRGIIATPGNQRRQAELLDGEDGTRLFIEQQHGDRVAALEYEPALAGAHRAVIALMRDGHFIEFEEIV